MYGPPSPYSAVLYSRCLVPQIQPEIKHAYSNQRAKAIYWYIILSTPYAYFSGCRPVHQEREREREREREHKPLCWSALVSRPAWHASPLSLSKHEYLASLFLPQHLRGQDNDNQMLSVAVTRSVQPLGSGIKWLA
jgi:hypothetical protein